MINARTGKYFICLLPFFELFTLEMLIARGILAQPLGLLTTVLSVARLLISAWMILGVLFRNIFSVTYTTWGIAIFSVARVISGLINGSFYIGMIIAAISYIGFVLLCEQMIYESKESFYKALGMLFGIFAILGAVSVWLFPNGFFYAGSKAEAVYLLGSKNSSFAYFLVFLLLWNLYSLRENQKLPRYGGIAILLFAVTEGICDSSNAILCLIILLFFFLLIKHNKKIYKCCTPLLLELAVVFMGIFIIFGSTSEFVGNILNALGRDFTFSGRNVLWRQAINILMANPLFGAGANQEFVLATGAVANHAHCFYLDTFAKYGILCFGTVAVMITCVMYRLSKLKKDRLLIMTGVFVFVYLVHCITEDASIYMLSVILLIAESLSINEKINFSKMNSKEK